MNNSKENVYCRIFRILHYSDKKVYMLLSLSVTISTALTGVWILYVTIHGLHILFKLFLVVAIWQSSWSGFTSTMSNVLLRCVNKVNKSKSFKTILWCDTVMNAMITILSSDVFWCVYRREQVLKDFNLITRYNITLFWLCMGTALSLACQLT